MAPKKTIHQVPTGVFARGMALAKLTMLTSARAAAYTVGGLFAPEKDQEQRAAKFLEEQVLALAHELGDLKGSLMKAGQMLSMYGEHFLPPEVNKILKTLQDQAPYVHWDIIEDALVKELGNARLADLQIDKEPVAAASLGQVHKAIHKPTGQILAIKVQYPNVDTAVESDLKTLKKLLSLSRLLPKGPNYDALFAEVRDMLHQEVDYRQEALTTQFFAEALAHDDRFIVPQVLTDYSTQRVLTTSFEIGETVDHPNVLSLADDRRNALAVAMLDLYLQELFVFAKVQTDPHFGNFRIRLGANNHPDQWVLLDFGAVRSLPQAFCDAYKQLIRGAYERNPETIYQAAYQLRYLNPNDHNDIKKLFVDFCYLMAEPFAKQDKSDVYDWGASDLPKRLGYQASKAIFATHWRAPPAESVFLDRKLGGIFILMQVLKARFKTADLIDKYLYSQAL